MPLTKIISGGQTGVDIAALCAAKEVGLQTGGWMPRGWRTLDGPKPSYARLYGMGEHVSSSYPPRTHANVRDADATLRIAVNFDSAGERCTHQGIVKHRKPYKDIELSDASFGGESMDEVALFLRDKRVSILNVAGNSEFTAPGIEVYAELYLRMLFRYVRATE